MDRVLFEQIIGVFQNKTKCDFCGKMIQNIHANTTHDKDLGKWYHNECYQKYKLMLGEKE
jgi:hypothetical protein